MNEGKLEMIKQEMSRVKINILGISKLKWMGMDEFNLDDHYIYYRGHLWAISKMTECKPFNKGQKW